jgi:hypothetical protein
VRVPTLELFILHDLSRINVHVELAERFRGVHMGFGHALWRERTLTSMLGVEERYHFLLRWLRESDDMK